MKQIINKSHYLKNKNTHTGHYLGVITNENESELDLKIHLI